MAALTITMMACLAWHAWLSVSHLSSSGNVQCRLERRRHRQRAIEIQRQLLAAVFLCGMSSAHAMEEQAQPGLQEALFQRKSSMVLAGGIRGFRIVLCCLAHTWVWQDDVCCLLALLASVLLIVPCQYLRGYNAITSQSIVHLFWIGHFQCFFGFLLLFVLCVGSLLFCFAVVVCFWVWFDSLDSDCCGLCTGSDLPDYLLCPLYGWALCINSAS